MDSPRPPARQRFQLVALALLASGVTFGLVVLAANWPLNRAREGHIAVGATGTAQTLPTPIAPYAAIDPALIPAYEAAMQRQSGIAVLSREIPPVGVYLPATGVPQLEPLTATPTTSLTAVPSSSPTATPQPTRTARPATGSSVTPAPVDGQPVRSPTPRPTVTLTRTPSPTPTPAPGFTPAPVAALSSPGVDCAPSGWPISGLLTQGFHRWHGGIDIAVDNAMPVKATHSGSVLYAGWRDDGYGNLVVIQNGRFVTYYGHLRDITVQEGDWAARGATIGFSGSTGNSSGPHVHYEIRIDDVPVDPLTFEARGFTPC